jgi:hypothetical protein
MAGTTRRLPTLRGEAIHCPAQAVAVNGLSRTTRTHRGQLLVPGVHPEEQLQGWGL